ncbi:transglycosylase SLT domain-containing protein [Trinickia sp.]|uniref:transglycosylase SLT domain-containing protein n=1 Tax=Trinickia sp. TaxID=2571163 RepID=UPI003F82172C
MADDLDKFVLQYTVDLRDSVARLEKLHEKMDGVKRRSKDAGGGFKEFASGAATELNKLAPGVEAVSAAVKTMGAEFAAAAAGIAMLAVGVKSVLDLRAQFNQQRQLGQEFGISSIRLEDYQRKLQRTGGGYVSRDQAAEGIKQFSALASTAYGDPSHIGREARLMRQLGVDVGTFGSPTGTVQRLSQLAATLHGKSDADVQGIARFAGMDPNWLLSVKKQGSAGMSNITDVTTAEIENRTQAQDSLDKFNAELTKFKENINELEIALGEKLLPAADKFLEWVTNLVTLFNTATTATAANDSSHKYIVGPGRTLTPNPNYVDPNGPAPTYNQGRYAIQNGHRVNLPDLPTGAGAEKQKQLQQKAEEDAKKEQAYKNALVSKEDEQNKQGMATANQMSLAANIFASAVNSFSNSMNLQQAWAAWAGEIGKANGIPGASTNQAGMLRGGGTVGWKSSAYKDDILAAANKYHLDPQMLYAIMMTESRGDPNAVSPTGAMGLMQVTKGNWKKLGEGRDARDAAANIDVGAFVLADQLRIHKGDMEAALNGYNGNSDAHYVDKVAKNYGSTANGIGQSRGSMNLRVAQAAIAGVLGVELQQIQLGSVTAGDAGYAYAQAMAGDQLAINRLQQQIAAGPQPGVAPGAFAKLQMDLRTKQQEYAALKQWGQQIVSSQQAGGQEWTKGQFNPVFNISINGTTDPKAVAEEVQRQLNKGMLAVLNHYSSGVKG